MVDDVILAIATMKFFFSCFDLIEGRVVGPQLQRLVQCSCSAQRKINELAFDGFETIIRYDESCFTVLVHVPLVVSFFS
jgi:hypothetical protein